MEIYLASDHGGYALKQGLLKLLGNEGYKTTDCGNTQEDVTDDYPDFVEALANALRQNPNGLGVVICRNGVGVSMAANRFPFIRAALGFNTRQVRSARTDDNANVLALPADYLNETDAFNIVRVFIDTPFSKADRHIRRLAKVDQLVSNA